MEPDTKLTTVMRDWIVALLPRESDWTRQNTTIYIAAELRREGLFTEAIDFIMTTAGVFKGGWYLAELAVELIQKGQAEQGKELLAALEREGAPLSSRALRWSTWCLAP